MINLLYLNIYTLDTCLNNQNNLRNSKKTQVNEMVKLNLNSCRFYAGQIKKQPNKFTWNKSYYINNNKGIKGKNPVMYNVSIDTKKAYKLKPIVAETIRVLLVRKFKKRKKVKNVKHQKYIAMMARKAAKQRLIEEKHKFNPLPKKSTKKPFKYFLLKHTFNMGLCKKPLQARMGKGKGKVYTYVHPMRDNNSFLEFSTRALAIRKIYKLIKLIKKRMPEKNIRLRWHNRHKQDIKHFVEHIVHPKALNQNTPHIRHANFQEQNEYYKYKNKDE